MKRHIQQPGVRQWAGEDLIELQAEPLKALDSFFSEYGPCIIQGCQVTDNGNDTYAIAPGLVALSGTDVDGKDTFKVVPFSGVSNVPVPVYFTLAHSVVERSYLDGQVKPIAYNYRAEVSTVQPEGEYLELSEDSVIRFVDVIQCDAEHRFFSDTERLKLQGIAEGANKYVHPASHPASMIAEATNKRFMTDAERITISSAALKDFSNVTSQSLGQNGYCKFPNGLMIQWGKHGNGQSVGTVYFPVSFYDASYSLNLTSVNGNPSNDSSWIANYINLTSSRFGYNNKYQQGPNSGGNIVEFCWIAIGRWK